MYLHVTLIEKRFQVIEFDTLPINNTHHRYDFDSRSRYIVFCQYQRKKDKNRGDARGWRAKRVRYNISKSSRCRSTSSLAASLTATLLPYALSFCCLCFQGYSSVYILIALGPAYQGLRSQF